jgi:hypothetical protein
VYILPLTLGLRQTALRSRYWRLAADDTGFDERRRATIPARGLRGGVSASTRGRGRAFGARRSIRMRRLSGNGS